MPFFNPGQNTITSPRCTVGLVNPSNSAFYQSKGRVDGSLDEPMLSHNTLKILSVAECASRCGF